MIHITVDIQGLNVLYILKAINVIGGFFMNIDKNFLLPSINYSNLNIALSIC